MNKLQLTIPQVRETQLAWVRRVLRTLMPEWRRKQVAGRLIILTILTILTLSACNKHRGCGEEARFVSPNFFTVLSDSITCEPGQRIQTETVQGALLVRCLCPRTD